MNLGEWLILLRSQSCMAADRLGAGVEVLLSRRCPVFGSRVHMHLATSQSDSRKLSLRVSNVEGSPDSLIVISLRLSRASCPYIGPGSRHNLPLSFAKLHRGVLPPRARGPRRCVQGHTTDSNRRVTCKCPSVQFSHQ